jgi:hypothetical protein
MASFAANVLQGGTLKYFSLSQLQSLWQSITENLEGAYHDDL